MTARNALIVWIVIFTTLVSFELWRTDRIAENHAKGMIANCLEIEEVKAGARQAAWRDFNRLDQNLRLLGIKKTPAIRKAAKEARDRRLAQYRYESCPRKTDIPPEGGTP